MMTTMAAMFGALPLAIGMGIGSELRKPLGVAIVGRPHRFTDTDALHNSGDLSGARSTAATENEMSFARWQSPPHPAAAVGGVSSQLKLSAISIRHNGSDVEPLCGPRWRNDSDASRNWDTKSHDWKLSSASAFY